LRAQFLLRQSSRFALLAHEGAKQGLEQQLEDPLALVEGEDSQGKSARSVHRVSPYGIDANQDDSRHLLERLHVTMRMLGKFLHGLR
jgi:hypothetical protein